MKQYTLEQPIVVIKSDGSIESLPKGTIFYPGKNGELTCSSQLQLPKEILESLVDNYDYINPEHYKKEDGRQTWERMVDRWGKEKTALWCEMTAFKYTDARLGRKPGEDEEREQSKIEWYLNKAKELSSVPTPKKRLDALDYEVIGKNEEESE